MQPLHFTGDKRDAAKRLLDPDLSLVHALDLSNAVSDDGTTLVVDLNADAWGYLSSGQQIMAQVLEQIADRRTTVVPGDMLRLDEDHRRAVWDAYGLIWHLIFAGDVAA